MNYTQHTSPHMSRPPSRKNGQSQHFKEAKRHASAVKILRIFLPVCAFVALSLYFLTSQISIKVGPGDVNIDKIALSGKEIRMERPSYTGFDERNGKYVVEAAYALQNIKQPYVFNLHDIKAKTNNNNKEWVQLLAKKGKFHAKKEWLQLDQGIDITTHSGMKAKLKNAHVNMKTRKIKTDNPVVVETPNGNMRADKMEINTSSQHIVFKNNVYVVLQNPDSGTPQKAQPQNSEGLANIFQRGSNVPIEVASKRLEVFNKKQIAMFKGQVSAIQGDMQMQSDNLEIAYKANNQNGNTQSTPDTDQAQQISQIRAQDNVVITTGNGSKATADSTVFDNQKQLITLNNNVRLGQDKNLLTGDKLVIDLQKRHSYFPASKNRIKGKFHQNPNTRRAARQQTPQDQNLENNAVNNSAPVFSGFASNDNAPIFIESKSLDIYDKDQLAIFSGKVIVNRGGNVIRSGLMELHYSGSAPIGGGNSQTATANGQIKKIIAKKKVFITSQNKDTVSGDKAVFDLKTDTATIEGNVILSQGDNVLKGEKLVINLKTGEYRLKDATPNNLVNQNLNDGQNVKQRVRLMFTPKNVKKKQ